MSITEALVEYCSMMYDRNMVSSTGGNASVRAGRSFWVTPTGRSLARLQPADLVEVGRDGETLSEGRPTKELRFHLAIYQARPDVTAILHGHNAYAVAASALLTPDEANALPVYTAGYRARVGRLPMLPYLDSGSAELAEALAVSFAGDMKAVLLQNHGFVAVGPDLQTAYDTADELLDALQVFILSRGRARSLDGDPRADAPVATSTGGRE